MSYIKRAVFVLWVLSVLTVTACFSPYRGEEGNLVISMGGGSSRIAALQETTISELRHTITLTSESGRTLSRADVVHGDTVSFSVAPGTWTIGVKAYYGSDVAASSESVSVEIHTGSNPPVSVRMTPEAEFYPPGLYRVTTGAEYPLVTDPDDSPIDPHDLNAVFEYIADPDNTNSGPYHLVIGKDIERGADDPLVVYGELTIVGAGGKRTIGSNPSSPVFNVEGYADDTASLTLGKNITLRGAAPAASTAPLVTVGEDGTFTLDGAVITSNNNTSTGGGVYVSAGNFYMKSGTISGNEAPSGGGVYFSGSGELTMSGGTISGNTAGAEGPIARRGGGVWYNGTHTDGFVMSGGRIEGNTAYGHGGGVYVDSGKFTISDSAVISGNHAKYPNPTDPGQDGNGSGGGLSVQGSGATVTMTDGTISGNDAEHEGGGVYLAGDSSVTMSGGRIENNTAARGGGGVFINESNFTLKENGIISVNTVGLTDPYINGNGGGVCVFAYNSDATFTMEGGTISGNKAVTGNGGGVVLDASAGNDNPAARAKLAMIGGTISGNTATAGQGGGVYVATDGVLNKTSGSGTIYGIDGGADSNSAGAPDSAGNSGHAVYVSPTLYRDGTAGPTVDLDSTDTTNVSGNWNDTATALPEGAIAITSRDDLLKIGNSAYPAYPLEGHYILMANINVGSWTTPIGPSGTGFTGTFDGNNGTYSITGISISGSAANTGLFGIIGEHGTVENLTMRDVSVEATEGMTGAIAGTNYGIIRNCHVIVADGQKIQGPKSTGGITGQNFTLQSIQSIVENCSVDGDVFGTAVVGNTGGIAGNNGGTVKNCFFNGTVECLSNGPAGGITGNNTSIIENCISMGALIKCYNAGPTGSITTANQATGTVRNCVALIETIVSVPPYGRILGSNAGRLFRNYAWSGMTMNNIQFPIEDKVHNGLSGADVVSGSSGYNSKGWWNGSSASPAVWHTADGGKPWTFYPDYQDSPWEWDGPTDNGLPKLRDMPMPQ